MTANDVPNGYYSNIQPFPWGADENIVGVVDRLEFLGFMDPLIYAPPNTRSRSRLFPPVATAKPMAMKVCSSREEQECVLERYDLFRSADFASCAIGCHFKVPMSFLPFLVDMNDLRRGSLHNYGCPASTVAEESGQKPINICCVCLLRSVNVVFGSCGHAVACLHCAIALWDHQRLSCPTCRHSIFVEVEWSSALVAMGNIAENRFCVRCGEAVSQTPDCICIKRGCGKRSVICVNCVGKNHKQHVCVCCNSSLRRIYT